MRKNKKKIEIRLSSKEVDLPIFYAKTTNLQFIATVLIMALEIWFNVNVVLNGTIKNV